MTRSGGRNDRPRLRAFPASLEAGKAVRSERDAELMRGIKLIVTSHDE
jgi:hypothetical protein